MRAAIAGSRTAPPVGAAISCVTPAGRAACTVKRTCTGCPNQSTPPLRQALLPVLVW